MKYISANEAAKLIKDNTTIATGGFVNIGFAKGMAMAIERRFLETSEPRGLTLVHAAGQADIGHYAHEGLLQKVIAGYYGWSKEMQRLVLESKVEAYNLPQGVIVNLYREISAVREYHDSSIGWGTFVEKSYGRLNEKSKEVPVLKGLTDPLRYLTFPIDVAIIKLVASGKYLCTGTMPLETISLAMAARNSGGIVIAEIVPGPIEGHTVPETLVDYAVSGSNQAQTVSMRSFTDIQRQIATRAAALTRPGDVVNIGIGLPELVGFKIKQNEPTAVLTTEAGSIGGLPNSGMSFGGALGMECALDAGQMFDFYNGGGLDIAFLGFAEIDKAGNVNVSKFSGRLTGCGGFIDITQSAKRLVFVGAEEANGKSKFVDQVEHLTFNAKDALKRGCEVHYVTDKETYLLTEDGLK
jgi:propionate CoA-transferase